MQAYPTGVKNSKILECINFNPLGEISFLPNTAVKDAKVAHECSTFIVTTAKIQDLDKN